MAVKYDDVWKYAMAEKDLSPEEATQWAIAETNRVNQTGAFAPQPTGPGPGGMASAVDIANRNTAPAPVAQQTWDKPATMFLVGQDRQDYANYLQNQIDSGATAEAWRQQLAATPGLANTWTEEAMQILPYKWSEDVNTRRAATATLERLGITNATPLPQGFVNPNFLPGGYNPVTGQAFSGHTAYSGMANQVPGGDITGGLGQNGAFDYLQNGGYATPGGFVPTGSLWDSSGGVQGGGMTPGGQQYPPWLQANNAYQNQIGYGGANSGYGQWFNTIGRNTLAGSPNYGYGGGYNYGMPFFQTPMYGAYQPSYYGGSAYGSYNPYSVGYGGMMGGYNGQGYQGNPYVSGGYGAGNSSGALPQAQGGATPWYAR